MTVERISSAVNKQVLYETLAIFFGTRLLLIYFYPQKGWQSLSPYHFPKAPWHREMLCVLLCLFLFAWLRLVVCLGLGVFFAFLHCYQGKNISCNFPGSSLRQWLSVKGHHGAALDTFLSIRLWFGFFFFLFIFFLPIVTTLLCCFTDFPAVLLLWCLKLNTEKT